MTKNELVNFTRIESHCIKKFIEQLDSKDNLLDIYQNLHNYDISIGKRAAIKQWMNRYGAEFYSLGILKHYTWVRYIGKGSFSKVHLIATSNKQEHALKISVSTVKDKNILKLFNREIEILKSLKHSYIISVINYGYNSNIIWYLTDYCNLGSLDVYLINNNQCSQYMRYKFLLHISEALCYIHSKNIIHRDIKPANIFINGNDYNDTSLIFKLGDFNLSRVIESPNCNLSVCGTHNYMSPEQINNLKYDFKVDVWSLMCVFIELVLNIRLNPINLDTTELLDKLVDINHKEMQFIKLCHVISANNRASSCDIKQLMIDNVYTNNKSYRLLTFKNTR